MKHGGNLSKLRDLYDLDQDLVDFSANINPLGLAHGFKEIIKSSLEDLEVYPDFDYKALKEALGTKYGLDPGAISLGNGCEDIIRNYIFLQKKDLVLIEPSFSEYRRAGDLAGLGIYSYVLKKDQGFRLNIADFLAWLASLDKKDLVVFLCNPTNPTGVLYSLREIEELLQGLKDRGHSLVLDESFIDFTREDSAISLLNSFPNLLILRSLTKFYAMPGLRLGFSMSGDKKLIEDLEDFRCDWAVNALAEACGRALDDLGDYEERTLAYVDRERKRIQEGLDGLDHIDLIGSSGNFSMIYTDIENFYEKMLAKSIVLRDCSTFIGLGPGYYRMAVRTEEENRVLLKALEELDRDGL